MHRKLYDRASVMGFRFVDGGEGQQGAAPAPVSPQQPPTPQQPVQYQAPQAQVPAQAPDGSQAALPNGEHGYPENTATDRMTAEQQAAYWKHRSRKHENTWKGVIDKNLTPEQVLEMQQQLDEANVRLMSDQDKAIAEAKKAAAGEVRTSLMPHLVQAKIEAAVARQNPSMTDEAIQSHLEFLDLTKFLTPKGEVDTDKVTNYASQFQAAPADTGAAGKKFPDMGGGKRGPMAESAKARAKQVARERGYIRDVQ